MCCNVLAFDLQSITMHPMLILFGNITEEHTMKILTATLVLFMLAFTASAEEATSEQEPVPGELQRDPGGGGWNPEPYIPNPGYDAPSCTPRAWHNGGHPDTDAIYTISWSACSSNFSRYELSEMKVSSGSWSTIYSGTNRSFTVRGRGNGYHWYRVIACNYLCGSYSNKLDILVSISRPSTPRNLTSPSLDSDGRYRVSWSSSTSGPISRYELWEAVGTSYWAVGTQVYSGTSTSYSISGKADGTYRYRVRACNGAGCSNYTTWNQTEVSIRPGSPVGLWLPASPYTSGNFYMFWQPPTIGTPTRYEVYEKIGSGSWRAINTSLTTTSIYISGKTSGTYRYKVRACNRSGCGSYTPESSINIVMSPGIPTDLNSPATSYGTHTITQILT